MNPCDELEPLLSALVDHELDPRQHARIRDHLTACPLCASRYQLWQHLHSMLTGEPFTPSDRFQAAVAGIPQRARRRSADAWMLVGAAAAVVFMLGWWHRYAYVAAPQHPDTLASLQWIHRVQESAQRSTLNTCEWDLRLLKLQLDQLEVPPDRKSDLLVRLDELMRRVRMEKSKFVDLQPGA